jgi:hypothetical protein
MGVVDVIIRPSLLTSQPLMSKLPLGYSADS